DDPPRLEAAPRRSGRAVALRVESLPRAPAALCPRRALPLCLRTTRRSRRPLVDPRGAGPLAAAALGRRPAADRRAEEPRLALGRRPVGVRARLGEIGEK